MQARPRPQDGSSGGGSGHRDPGDRVAVTFLWRGGRFAVTVGGLLEGGGNTVRLTGSLDFYGYPPSDIEAIAIHPVGGGT